MRPQFLACIQITFFAALAASSQVSVEVTDPFSSFTYCGAPKVVEVIFQTVTGYSDDGTPVVFKRYWVSETTAALVLERLPDPLKDSTIRECANSIAAAGHDAFEFSSGTCTAIKLSSFLCCEEVSGSHVYVSELFDGGSGDPKLIINDESTGMTIHRFSPIVDFSLFLEVTTSENENAPKPRTGKAAYKSPGGTIYTFFVDYIDLANCISTDVCSSFVYYHRGPSPTLPNNPLYFTDYCGGAIPDPIEFFQAIHSHRGFGCEYMPNELLDNECVVEMNLNSDCPCYVDIDFSDRTDGDRATCDGLSLIFNGTSTSGTQSHSGELCESGIYGRRFRSRSGYTYQYRLSMTKPNRLGFVIAHMDV